jgi:hypothetical protein
MKSLRFGIAIFILIISVLSCTKKGKADKDSNNKMEKSAVNSYSDDKAFLEKYTKLIELKSGNSRVLLSGDLQGRVFTSSATGDAGLSFGWINYKHFLSGEVSKQFNPYGGEERLWLGPEGGPFSIYFEKGKEQDFESWRVPSEIDTTPYDVVNQSGESVSFKKDFELVNYSGTKLKIGIERRVKLLNERETKAALSTGIDESLDFVAYESENALINKGPSAWDEKSGVLSIWMLSMFNPSPVGVVFIPYKEGPESELGKIVTDDYFGKVPEERLIKKDGIIFFNIDGKYRSKIGISPERAMPYAGSYDSQKKVLTILWLSLPGQPAKYVNSVWGKQEEPLKGDAVNSYNDGPVSDGSIMGPFYEIESSSPAAFLAPGENIKHMQRIFHITGSEAKLSEITKEIFNLSIEEIKQAFEK